MTTVLEKKCLSPEELLHQNADPKKILESIQNVAFEPQSLSRKKRPKNLVTLAWKQKNGTTIIGIRVKNNLLENFSAGRRFKHEVSEHLTGLPILHGWITTKNITVTFTPFEQSMATQRHGQAREKEIFDENLVKSFCQKVSDLLEEMASSSEKITLREWD